MSLNSFADVNGLEMGRAQVTQAIACGLKPQARMNPVLLKPCSDTGSQLIVCGKVEGHLKSKDFLQTKKKLFTRVKESYDALASEHELMILEGAGSPAEVNLQAADIVNMNMAEHAGAHVLLVGDIDRGGVFAHLLGTQLLIEDKHKKLLKGFILNRFRGDESLLAPAIKDLEERTKQPVLGIVPWLEHGLPEEDSVSFKENKVLENSGAGVSQTKKCVDVALLDLPHICNTTDFEPLRHEPDIKLRLIKHPRETGNADLLIIPGSKNTIADLQYLKELGMQKELERLIKSGCQIIGICGGFQMLGEDICDPHHCESEQSTAKAFSLLPVKSRLQKTKTLCQTRAVHTKSNIALEGYEIHHGLTTISQSCAQELRQPVEDTTGRTNSLLSFESPDGMILGCYLHGMFDSAEFRHYLINSLRKKKKLAERPKSAQLQTLDESLNKLAATLFRHCDINAIRSMLNI